MSKRASAPYRSGRDRELAEDQVLRGIDYEVAGVLREPGRPAVAYMVTPDKERRYVGGAFITLNDEDARAAMGARARPRRKPVKGVEGQAGHASG